jgi:D-alanyl-D-alanine carboxypeptidase
MYSWKFAGVSGLNRLTLLLLSLALVAIFGAGMAQPGNAAERGSAIVVDANSRSVLFAEAPDAARYPASLTKMMTLYLAFDALDRGRLNLSQRLIASQHAATQAPSAIGIRPGEAITVEQAILGITTKSANDAAVTLAEAMGGSESNFAVLMTQRAQSLGMTNTVFRNASGLPNRQQHTTARDMATLALALWNNHRDYYHYFSVREFAFDGHTHLNHNHMLANYDGADGIKTGYIRDSGFNLVASAQRNGRRLIGVVFGGTSVPARDQQMARLLDQGFGRQDPSSDMRYASLNEGKPGSGNITPKTMDKLVASLNSAQSPAAADLESTVDQGSTNAERDTWTVQVGAFGKAAKAEHQAHKAIKAASRTLQADKVSIEAEPDESGKLFRSRIAGLSEREARDACRELHRKKFICVPIAPN